PEEAVRDRLAAVAGAAAINVRCAAHVRVNAGTGAAGPAARAGGETRGAGGRAVDARPRVHTFLRRARRLGAVDPPAAAHRAAGIGRAAHAVVGTPVTELTVSVAGGERTGLRTDDVEVGGGSGRGGAARDRAVSPAADIQTGGAEVGDLRRAGGVGVDLARERRSRRGREARSAAGRRAGSRRVLERERRAGGAGRARRRARRGARRRARRGARRRARRGARRRARRGARRRRGRRRAGRRRGRRARRRGGGRPATGVVRAGDRAERRATVFGAVVRRQLPACRRIPGDAAGNFVRGFCLGRGIQGDEHHHFEHTKDT